MSVFLCPYRCWERRSSIAAEALLHGRTGPVVPDAPAAELEDCRELLLLYCLEASRESDIECHGAATA